MLCQVVVDFFIHKYIYLFSVVLGRMTREACIFAKTECKTKERTGWEKNGSDKTTHLVVSSKVTTTATATKASSTKRKQ